MDYAEGLKKDVAEIKFLIHDLRVEWFFSEVHAIAPWAVRAVVLFWPEPTPRSRRNSTPPCSPVAKVVP